ncbi:DUF3696 domain-containing protein [Nonomuraea sp. NPDC052129]|uniref:DUF3696 domain-containing protein n=1 Tax=Nonomuraea sp. NPDC052129 TaxID=3154651 RepID=UPI00341B9D74
MPLARFVLENYRCFRTRQEVELRPITVVLGKNNSGKSALVRAPLVLRTGIRTMSPLPFDLDQLGESGPDFLDLVHGRNPHGRIGVRLDFEREGVRPHSLSATVQNVDEWGYQLVSSLAIEPDSKYTHIGWDEDDPDRADWPRRHELKDGHAYFVSNGEDDVSRIRLPFYGLLPAIRHDQAYDAVYDTTEADRLDQSEDIDLDQLIEAIAIIRSEFDDIRYLSPYRERPRRVYRFRSRRPATVVGANGESALDIVAHDELRRRSGLLNRLNGYLDDNISGWKLGIQHHEEGVYSAVMRSTFDGKLEVSLADAGTGVTQLLPILVQRAVDAVMPPEQPTLEIIEEPELHLHPSAHARLADLFMAAAQESNVRFLIETHSETFMLRLRRRIAEGAIAPDDVAIYFVEHEGGVANARRIGIDQLGNLDYWPRGVFAEDFEETRALAAAQIERSEADAG